MKAVACYVRVSTTSQNEAGQRRELRRWLTGNGIDPDAAAWFIDKETGDHMARPAFERLKEIYARTDSDREVYWSLWGNRDSQRLFVEVGNW